MSFLTPSRRFAAFVAGAALLVVVVQLTLAGPDLLIVDEACVYAIAALGLNVIFGMTGLLSVAQAALMGIGGYTLTLMVARHVGMLPALALACVAAAAVSALTGVIGGRIRSHYFILISLALAEGIILVLVNDMQLTGGTNGVALAASPTVFGLALGTPDGFAYVAVPLVFAIWYLTDCLRASRFGIALLAISTDEYLAAVAGIATNRYRVLATVVGGAYAGFAGGLLTIADSYIGPQNFGLDTGILLLLIVVLAGAGSNAGTVVAALILTYLAHGLLTLTVVGELIYGLAIVILIIVAPDGLAGLGRLARRGARTAWLRLTARGQPA